MVTSLFDIIFIIIRCVERQNVVVKSNILTMLNSLKPPTILFSSRDKLKPFHILQLIQRRTNFVAVRAKRLYIMPRWVCLKVSKMFLFQSIWRKRRFIKLWFLMWLSVFDQFCCAWFTQNILQNYVLSVETCWLPTFHDIIRLFRSTSHSSYFRKFHRNHKYDPTNMF